MMKKLDKGSDTSQINFEPNEGERILLSNNKGGMRSPFLGFLDTSSESVSDEMILDYLASIIVDIYLDKTYGNNTNKESSYILSGINKRAS